MFFVTHLMTTVTVQYRHTKQKRKQKGGKKQVTKKLNDTQNNKEL